SGSSTKCRICKQRVIPVAHCVAAYSIIAVVVHLEQRPLYTCLVTKTRELVVVIGRVVLEFEVIEVCTLPSRKVEEAVGLTITVEFMVDLQATAQRILMIQVHIHTKFLTVCAGQAR